MALSVALGEVKLNQPTNTERTRPDGRSATDRGRRPYSY